MQRTVLKLVFCIIVVLCLTASVYAASGVSLEVGPRKTAKPGDLVTLVFVIENTGTVADQYNLKLTLPAGWAALPIPSQVSLTVGETKQVFLTVIVPGGATAGTYAAVLRATSVGDPSVWAEAELRVMILPPPVPPFEIHLIMDTEITVNEEDVLSLDTLSLIVSYGSEKWGLQAQPMFSNEGFSSLSFSGDAKVGYFDLSSLLEFDASTASFQYWRATASVNLFGVYFTDVIYLNDEASTSYNQLTMTGGDNGTSLEFSAKFSICQVEFQEATISSGWEWPECGLTFDGTISFTDDEGFEYFELVSCHA